MSEKNNSNNLSQNKDELEPKPQPVNKIKEPENIIKSKEKKQKNINIPESNIASDDIEHPIPMISDYQEEEIDDIKKSFYENKEKEKMRDKFKNEFVLEELSLVENKNNLKSNFKEISPKKLNKFENDSIKLKENIGKIKLNSRFMKDKNIKNIKKNNSISNYLLYKPEKVVDNFTLESSIKNNEKLKIKKINNNANKNVIKKNNSLNCLKHVDTDNNKIIRKQKIIKEIFKEQNYNTINKINTIKKIPLNLNLKGQLKNNQNISNNPNINKNEKSPNSNRNNFNLEYNNAMYPQPNLIINKSQKINAENNNKNEYALINTNKKQIIQPPNKTELKKISLKTLKLMPINNNSKTDLKNPKNIKTTNTQINLNYSNKIKNKNSYYNNNINNSAYFMNKQGNILNIRNSQNKENYSYNNNLNLSNIIINNNYIYTGKNNNNLSFEYPKNLIKMTSPGKLQQSIRNSNEMSSKIIPKKNTNKIPLPYKVNNDLIKSNNNNNNQFYTITKDIYNFSSNSKAEINNSMLNTIGKINDFYNDSENCNKKTIENGGKFNNISTTYVVISKNSKKKENFIPKIPKPTLTIENPNMANKINPLYPSPSALSIKSQQSNNNHYICPFYSPINQKIPTNNEKIIKFNKSQINIVNNRNINSFSLRTMNENNISRNNYSNNVVYKANTNNIRKKGRILYINNKMINSPINYKYDFDYDYDYDGYKI